MRHIDVSIIFVYFNTPSEILKAIKSVKKACGRYSYEVIVVDNESSKKIPKKTFELEEIIYLKNKNVGYGAGLNFGTEKAKGKFLVLSNPDLIFEKNSVEKMIEKMNEDSSIGIIGPAFLDEKNKIRRVGNDIPTLPNSIFALSSLGNIFPHNYFSNKYFINKFDRKSEQEIPVLCGACMVIKRETFKKIKGFDKRFFMYFEEADICLRINKLGLRVVYYPIARVIHYVGRSSTDLKWITRTYEKSRLEFLRKHYGWLLGTITETVIRAINLPARFI